MAEFTKGPWKAAKDNYGVLRIWAGTQSLGSCESDGGLSNEEEQANAKLISQSPAMFDLLKAIYRTKLYPERFTVKIEKIIGEVEK